MDKSLKLCNMIDIQKLWSDKIEVFMSNKKEDSDNLYPTSFERIWYPSISHITQSKNFVLCTYLKLSLCNFKFSTMDILSTKVNEA